MTYNEQNTSRNEQEMTWNNLQRARNDLERPTVSKKRPTTTYKKEETIWNGLQRTDSNFMERLYLKNNQLERSNVRKKQWINSVFAIFRIICACAKWR